MKTETDKPQHTQGEFEQYLPKDWIEYYQYKKPLKDIKEFGYAEAEKHKTVENKGTFTIGVNVGIKEAEERLIPIIQKLVKDSANAVNMHNELIEFLKELWETNYQYSSNEAARQKFLKLLKRSEQK